VCAGVEPIHAQFYYILGVELALVTFMLHLALSSHEIHSRHGSQVRFISSLALLLPAATLDHVRLFIARRRPFVVNSYTCVSLPLDLWTSVILGSQRHATTLLSIAREAREKTAANYKLYKNAAIEPSSCLLKSSNNMLVIRRYENNFFTALLAIMRIIPQRLPLCR